MRRPKPRGSRRNGGTRSTGLPSRKVLALRRSKRGWPWRMSSRSRKRYACRRNKRRRKEEKLRLLRDRRRS